MAVSVREWTTAKGEPRKAWVVRYSDQHGKWHLKTFKKKKEADAFDSTTHVEVMGRIHVADSETITVEEAGKHWLATCEAAGLERSTLAQYRQHLNRHIVPLIGRSRLTEITIPFVRAFLDRLRGDGRSTAMQRNVRVSLGSILSDAQERGLVVRNAVKDMGRDKSGRTRAAGRHKKQVQIGVDVPTSEEVRALLGAATGRVRVFLMTAIFTGLRASELRGLRWSDVDLEKSVVHVRQRADAFQDIGSPKSKKGRRSIPIVTALVSALKEWKEDCPKGELDLVFPNTAGNIEYHANIVKRWYAPAMIDAGVTIASDELDKDGNPLPAPKYSGLHALRHFYASWCINRKEDGGLALPAKVVQERLGHSSIQMTLDVYGHLFPTGDDASAMDDAATGLLQPAT